ncbi:MAG: hypothetical protein Salg2KO_17580 [Salibacteraceae bacterium]
MSLQRLNILYVEDNIGDRVILEDSLSDIVALSSFEHCMDIKEAKKALKKSTFDLIFLDLSLPDTEGIVGVSQLVELTRSSTPIIVLTGLNDHNVAIETLKVGVQDFLVKGDYNNATLSKAIQYAIGRHKVQLELIRRNQEILIATNKLSKAEELAELGSWEIDIKSQQVKLSTGMQRLLGINDDVKILSLGKFFKYVHHNKEGTDLRKLLSLSNAVNSPEFEINLVKQSGEVINTLCKTEVRLDESKNPVEIYGINIDVSKIKEAEKVKEEFYNMLENKVKERTVELEKTKAKLEKSLIKEKELGELKSRFVSTASHQFRTPLTVIQSNIGLLEMQTQRVNAETAKIIAKIADRVKNEVLRMTDIIGEVLVLGKISSGVITPVMYKASIVQICNHVVEKHNQIQEDGRQVSVEIRGTEKSVKLDANLFEQAFSNMISNAFKYSKGKKAPQLKIIYEDSTVTIEVSDSGIGIPEDDLKNLFTPFFRAAYVLDIPGNGLGTAIMKEYIELNNGTLKAESTLNKGTTFTTKFKTY